MTSGACCSRAASRLSAARNGENQHRSESEQEGARLPGPAHSAMGM